MRDFFSFSRFFKLFKEHWVRTWRSMLVISAVVGAMLAISLVSYELTITGAFFSPFKYNTVQKIIFELGFAIVSVLFAIYWYYSNWYKSKRITTLNLPVSSFERHCLGFVWFNIIFVLWYLTLFFIVNFIISSWAIQYEFISYTNHPEFHAGPYTPSLILSFFEPLKIFDLVYYSILVQVLLYSTLLWFHRFALVKSLVVVFVVVISYNWFQHYFIPTWLNPLDWEYEPYSLRKMINQDFSEFQEIKATSIAANLQRFHVQFVWLAIWSLIYYRIKEQEV